MSTPELIVVDPDAVEACVLGGVEHDYRAHLDGNIRCVWCLVIACEAPSRLSCIEPVAHGGMHRGHDGTLWPKGTERSHAA